MEGNNLLLKRKTNPNIPLVMLSNYTDMLEIAVEQNYVSDDEVNSLTGWRENLAEWDQ